MKAEAPEGFAHWTGLQSQEQQGHAMRLFAYMLERGARVELAVIEAPSTTFGSPLSIAQQALEHERTVADQMNRN